MMEQMREATLALLKKIHDDVRSSVTGLSGEALNWQPGPETNSLYVLVTHLLASEHFWLALAAGRTIPREREAEFRAHGDDAAALLRLVDEADARNPELVAAITENTLAAMVQARGEQQSGVWCLVHALEHCGQHRGQALLTRQLWDQAHPPS